MDYVVHQDGREVIIVVDHMVQTDKTKLEAIVKAVEDSEK